MTRQEFIESCLEEHGFTSEREANRTSFKLKDKEVFCIDFEYDSLEIYGEFGSFVIRIDPSEVRCNEDFVYFDSRRKNFFRLKQP